MRESLLHISHRSAMRRVGFVLALLFLILLSAWSLHVPAEMRGIAGYLPLHTLLETIAIIIASLVFAVGWNAYSEKLPGNIVLLSCAFLGVAILDFSHFLSYAGMPEYVTPSGPEKAIDFWLAARSLASVALFVVVVTPWRPYRIRATRYALLAAIIALTAAMHWLFLFHHDVLPHTFIPGQGLTPFKVNFEYVLIALNLATALVLWARMQEALPFDAAALFGAICTMALSEFFFTLYADVTDVNNLLGHLYKVIAYLFIYRAIFVTTVESPYRLLSASQVQLQSTLDAIPDLLFELDLEGRYHAFHAPRTELLAAPPETLLGKTVGEVMPAEAAAVVLSALHEAHANGWSNGKQLRLQLAPGEKWFELSVARMPIAADTPLRFIVLSRDITERKLAEQDIRRLSRLYNALSQTNKAIVHCSNETELFQQICRNVVDFGGMKMAWIGMLDEQGVLKPAASCGSTGVDAGEASRLTDKDAPQYVPSQRALRKDQPFWCQDYQNDPSISACHKVGVKLGWGACAALPLHRNGELVGTFSLYADEQGAFDESVRNLLMEMAADIDFALENFERDARRERAESELDDSNKLLNTVINTAPMRIFWKDAELHYLGCNTAFARDAGEDSPQDLLGKDDYQLGWKDQAELYRADDSQVMESGVPKLFYDEPQTTPDGKVIWLRTSKVPLRNTANETIGVLGIYEDITERKQTEVALQRSEASLNRAQAVAQVGSWTLNIKMNQLECSDESFRVFGVPKRDRVDLDTLVAAIHPDDRERVLKTWNDAVAGAPYDIEHRIVTAGQIRWVRERAEIERDTQGQAQFVMGTVQDITERKLAEERIQYLAHFDVLTGLPNRTQLEDRIKYAISLAKRNNGQLAVIFLDLDRFKDINDTLGHSIGDALLVELAGRLPTVLREEDTVSRFGGDEFIIMLPNSDPDGVAQVAQKLLEIVARPYRIEPYDLNVTASIGIAIFPDDGSTLETLSKNADTAMYHAKREGRNSYRFFTADMQAHSTRNLQLVNALRHALEKGQLHLVYQPQLSMHDGRIIGAEALLRWQHPELGTISPAEFIPVAEDSGLILPIGEWVLRQAVRQVRAWMDEGLAPLIVAVNLSAVQFHHPDLPELVTRVLNEEGLPPEYLELELTEGVAMHNPQGAVAIMDKLHERGIRMSIDDFGTGYSSLSYLKKFKVYKLKIDQSFVRDISTDPEDKAIVSAVISMAKSLGLQTIAEGVETVGQLAFLREQGCDEIQGYYYSKPLAAEQFRAYVKNSKDALSAT